MKKITDNVLYTGVLNPNMRVFDAIMHTEYGTSYNSYMVKGAEKIALIETAHAHFFDGYIEGLKEALGDRKPDYVIFNHTEPDHSGAVAGLLKEFPELKIYGSRAAINNLKNIANMSFDSVVVSDGDSLDLGGLTLEFIMAPFLHWPDTMFTWIKEEKTLATCDFLGSHYCEPQILDKRLAYADEYEKAAKHYYDCIFEPFASHVRNGLEKIKGLDVEYALTSHGPVLSKGSYLEKAIEWYSEWSKPDIHENLRIPIFYATAYNNTKLLAKCIRSGIKSALPDCECEIYDLSYNSIEAMASLMNGSDAFLLGSITINRGAVPLIMQLIALADNISIAKRPAAVFGSYGWSGEGITQAVDRLKSIKCNVAQDSFKVQLVPTEEDLKGAFAFGASFAESLVKAEK